MNSFHKNNITEDLKDETKEELSHFASDDLFLFYSHKKSIVNLDRIVRDSTEGENRNETT